MMMMNNTQKRTNVVFNKIANANSELGEDNLNVDLITFEKTAVNEKRPATQTSNHYNAYLTTENTAHQNYVSKTNVESQKSQPKPKHKLVYSNSVLQANGSFMTEFSNWEMFDLMCYQGNPNSQLLTNQNEDLPPAEKLTLGLDDVQQNQYLETN